MLGSLVLLAQTTADQVGGVAPITADPNGLPGGATAASMLDGLMYYGILLVIAGLILSAGMWAVGAFSNSHTQNVNGKKAFLTCIVCAMVIGGAYVLTAWFYDAGQSIT